MKNIFKLYFFVFSFYTKNYKPANAMQLSTEYSGCIFWYSFAELPNCQKC